MLWLESQFDSGTNLRDISMWTYDAADYHIVKETGASLRDAFPRGV
jgi:hypothetical protein